MRTENKAAWVTPGDAQKVIAGIERMDRIERAKFKAFMHNLPQYRVKLQNGSKGLRQIKGWAMP